MKILVTGSTGFIGSHLCARLIEEGHEVIGLSKTGRLDNIESIVECAKFELITCDVQDKEQIDSILGRGFDAVFHLASYISGRERGEDSDLCFDINAHGTKNILESAVENGVNDFVYASTMSVYSEPPKYLPVDEDHPTEPKTKYGQSKLKGEEYCRKYSESIRVNVIRLAGVYGKGLPGHHAIPKFFRKAMNNEPIEIHGDGFQTSDFIYIKSAVEGLLLPWKIKTTGTYNIGSGQETSVLELAEIIVVLTKSNSKIIISKGLSERPFRFVMDISRAKRELGYEPILLNEGQKHYLGAANTEKRYDIKR